MLNWERQKLTEDNLKVVLAKCLTLSWAVWVICIIAWHRQARPHFDLKTLPRLYPINFCAPWYIINVFSVTIL